MLLALFRRVASTSSSSSILTSSRSFWKTPGKKNNILRCVGTSLLLLSGNSVIPTTASVEALSITALPTSAAASTYPSKGSSTRLFSSAQEDSSSQQQQQQQQGKTGWNHNPPKNPDFYKPQTEVEAIAKALAENNNESTPKQQQFRTGWLHSNNNSNTGSTTKQQATTKPPSSAAGKARRRLEEAMKAQRENHRIVSPAAFHACGKNRQIMVTEHKVSVPLVHPKEEEKQSKDDGLLSSSRTNNNASGECIDVAFIIVEEAQDPEARDWYENVFATLTPTQRAAAYKKKCKLTSAKDMLLFLQGGPGFGAPTPIVALDFSKDGSSWGSAALDKYSRVVLLDQRGTGKSSPLTKQSLQQRFPNMFALDDDDDDVFGDDIFLHPTTDEKLDTFEKYSDSVKEATEFLAQFRADNIVRDAEWIRNVLMYTPSVDDDDEDDDDKNDADIYDPSKPNPWGCVLGQSFGGFCAMTYLSQIQHPPKICLLTGGIAPMLADSAKDVYESLWNKVKERNLKYYDAYPGDVNVVKTIVQTLLQAEEDNKHVTLPSGGRLTARRFLQLGMMLGGSPSSFASLHELLSSAFLQQPWTTSSSKGNLEFSRAFLKAIDHAQPFDEHPIYFWLHESIYADGKKNGNQAASSDIIANWSAESVFQAKLVGDNDEERSSSFINEYDYRVTSSSEDSSLPVLFFGEMVFPWMSEDYAECEGFGCTALANALASKSDWGPLYDASNMRAILNSGRSKCAAAIYYEDMYVDFDHSMKVCARGGPLEKCKVYITNEYQHSGLRDDGATIFNKLHGMATGSIRTPS